MVVDFLTDRSPVLGLKFVGAYDEKRIPTYPAIVIIPGDREKQLHASQTFNINLELHMYVYHADLTENKRERSKSDLKLVTMIESALEEDFTWKSDVLNENSRRLIFAYISDQRFGLLQPRKNASNVVISTQMTWRALSQRRFDAV